MIDTSCTSVYHIIRLLIITREFAYTIKMISKHISQIDLNAPTLTFFYDYSLIVKVLREL